MVAVKKLFLISFTLSMKTFNTAGTCFPDRHYMVDISDRIEVIRKMISMGDYFCINRGRQYGKTTTLKAIRQNLSEEYCIFSISFEEVEDVCYENERTLYANFVRILSRSFKWSPIQGLNDEVRKIILDFSKEHTAECSTEDLQFFISDICHQNSKPIVVIIDEVDQAGNHPSFLKFLGLLRAMFLNRDEIPTFQSVILAGVYDIKNLKLKLRPEEQHQYNSPWNIAVPFDVDMSLSQPGIQQMLDEYKADTQSDIDTAQISTLIRDYTAGYPFLVSRLCQLMQAQQDWSREGFLRAVKCLLVERNTLFDDMNKKLEQFPEMRLLLENILYKGERVPFTLSSRYIEIASMFGIIVNREGAVAVSNRIFETLLYEKFVTDDMLSSSKNRIYKEGQNSKPEFVRNDGTLDMPLILSRFVQTFNEVFGQQPDTFLEDEGRRYFLLFVKPIINGVGNYYIESQTRDGLRTDLIIDYLGHRYIIEMKIWRGNSYNQRGEQQLVEYLDRYNESTGYLLSFCFNKDKQQGLRPPVVINDRTLIEAVV